jgi:hypothetical protein
MRELDGAPGLSDLAAVALRDTRRGKNIVHRLDGLFRQSVFGRLALTGSKHLPFLRGFFRVGPLHQSASNCQPFLAHHTL